MDATKEKLQNIIIAEIQEKKSILKALNAPTDLLDNLYKVCYTKTKN